MRPSPFSVFAITEPQYELNGGPRQLPFGYFALWHSRAVTHLGLKDTKSHGHILFFLNYPIDKSNPAKADEKVSRRGLRQELRGAGLGMRESSPSTLKHWLTVHNKYRLDGLLYVAFSFLIVYEYFFLYEVVH